MSQCWQAKDYERMFKRTAALMNKMAEGAVFELHSNASSSPEQEQEIFKRQAAMLASQMYEISLQKLNEHGNLIAAFPKESSRKELYRVVGSPPDTAHFGANPYMHWETLEMADRFNTSEIAKSKSDKQLEDNLAQTPENGLNSRQIEEEAMSISDKMSNTVRTLETYLENSKRQLSSREREVTLLKQQSQAHKALLGKQEALLGVMRAKLVSLGEKVDQLEVVDTEPKVRRRQRRVGDSASSGSSNTTSSTADFKAAVSGSLGSAGSSKDSSPEAKATTSKPTPKVSQENKVPQISHIRHAYPSATQATTLADGSLAVCDENQCNVPSCEKERAISDATKALEQCKSLWAAGAPPISIPESVIEGASQGDLRAIAELTAALDKMRTKHEASQKEDVQEQAATVTSQTNNVQPQASTSTLSDVIRSRESTTSKPKGFIMNFPGVERPGPERLAEVFGTTPAEQVQTTSGAVPVAPVSSYSLSQMSDFEMQLDTVKFNQDTIPHKSVLLISRFADNLPIDVMVQELFSRCGPTSKEFLLTCRADDDDWECVYDCLKGFVERQTPIPFPAYVQDISQEESQRLMGMGHNLYQFGGR